MAPVQTTVLAALAHRLATDPDGAYLDFEGVGFSTRDMDVASTRLAHALAELGVGRGDRIATLLENGAEQVVSFFAALKLGAIQVPINTARSEERRVGKECRSRGSPDHEKKKKTERERVTQIDSDDAV